MLTGGDEVPILFLQFGTGRHLRDYHGLVGRKGKGNNPGNIFGYVVARNTVKEVGPAGRIIRNRLGFLVRVIQQMHGIGPGGIEIRGVAVQGKNALHVGRRDNGAENTDRRCTV